MSLFRKPKKIQRRVFSSAVDENEGNEEEDEPMDIDTTPPPPPKIGYDKKVEKKKDKSKESKKSSLDTKPKSLLSFVDEEDDAEVFQVRKSSNSKKIMRMLDKERRKKRREERETDTGSTAIASHGGGGYNENNSKYATERGQNGRGDYNSTGSSTFGSSYKSSAANSASSSSSKGNQTNHTNVSTASAGEQSKSKKTDSIQTEIRTDDFVLVVKKSEPTIVLNGRAALCAGRNDFSDDEDQNATSDNERNGAHRFSKPEQLKQMLESGSIPDAAMIHAARKRRQRAREQGDFIQIEEPKEEIKRGSRLAREDVEGDQSDEEERVDMNAITGIKEREERREQFYAVENDLTDDDSEHENNEWENQQIRKGVTGAQLVSAQQESVLSRFMIKNPLNALEYEETPQQSTSMLLRQAYAKTTLEKPTQVVAKQKIDKSDKSKSVALRTPQQIRDAVKNKLKQLVELNEHHVADIERISNELKVLNLERIACTQKAPTAAAKYRFYQEVKCYVTDLIDCLNEKVPMINELEQRALQLYSKHQHFLIERRRQDVRDQAKEMAEASKPTPARRGPEYEEQVRRAAEREGRRTRRRCEREKSGMLATHFDGMSSDEETSDRYEEIFQNSLEQIDRESEEILNDVTDEFSKVEMVLNKFYAWRRTDMDSYKDAFVSQCLPKILGPLIRLEMLNWSPLLDEYKELDKMNWYAACMLYASSENETIEELRNDPDLYLVPTIIEKIVIPKVNDIVRHCWDPLSTRQTLRLIGFINRLGRDYPLKEHSKHLQQLFKIVLEKMKLALENDVFIPIFPKQVQEAKTSFFQRQFCSGLKLFRNFLSWQGIISDGTLRELAISLLLNRYLLLAMRVCTANDAIAKAYIIVNTLPTVWLQPGSETLNNLELFTTYIKQTFEQCDPRNPLFMSTCDKAKQVLQRLHSI